MREHTLLQLIRWAGYAMLVGVPVLFVPGVMQPFIIPKTALFQACALFIVSAWVGLAIVHPRYRLRWTPLSISIILFLLWITIASLAFGSDWRVSLWSTPVRTTGLIFWWHVGFLALALGSLGKELPWRRFILVSFLTSASIGAGALVSGLSTPVAQWFLSDPSRPAATFGNPTFLAGYLLLNIWGGLWLVASDHVRSIRWWSVWGVGMLVLLGALFTTQTRGDVLGLFVGGLSALLVLAVARFRQLPFPAALTRNWWMYALLGCILLGGVGVVLQRAQVINVPVLDRLESAAVIREGLQFRLIAWQGAREAFLERPITGWGLENFNIGFQKHYDPRLLTTTFAETYWDKAHNVFIEYAVTVGVVGLLLFLAILVSWVYESWTLTPILRAIMVGVVVAYSTRSLVIFDTVGVSMMLCVFIGLAHMQYRAHRRPIHGDGEAAHASTLVRFVPASALLLGIISAIGINLPMVYAARLEHGGPNWFLLQDLDKSEAAFRSALAIPQPYRDQLIVNFASTVRQAYQDGTPYPKTEDLQQELAQELEGVRARHSTNYFQYAYLAEFKNAFAPFNSAYLNEADALTEQALTLSPQRQQVYYIRAKTALLRGDKDGAFKIFEEAIALNPAAGDPYFYLGLIALELGNAPRGIEAIQQARARGRDAQNAEEAIALGTLIGDVADRYDVAVRYYDRALTFLSEGNQKDEVLLRRAIALFYSKQNDEARKAFQDLSVRVTYRSLPFFSGLKPILDELKVSY